MADEITVSDLALELETNAWVLDVREDDEFADGHVPNVHHIPLGQLPDKFHLIPKAEKIFVICRSGARSQSGAGFAISLWRGLGAAVRHQPANSAVSANVILSAMASGQMVCTAAFNNITALRPDGVSAFIRQPATVLHTYAPKKGRPALIIPVTLSDKKK